MSININVSGLLKKGEQTLATASNYRGVITSGNVLTNQNLASNKITANSSLKRISALDHIKEGHKKKMSPQVIAKRIAQGKGVSQEEKNFLRQNCLELYRKAVTANRIRENLEIALKSAKSDTAKASAVSAATTLASTLATMDAKGEGSDTIVSGAELYSDAIQAALKNGGSKKLNEELEQFTKIENNPTEEDLTQEDISQEDLTQEDITQEDLTQEDISQEDLMQEDIT